MNCDVCGAELPESAEYCENCETAVSEDTQAAPLRVFEEAMEQPAPAKKPVDKLSLALSIIGLVSALFDPIVSLPCCVAAIVTAARQRKTNRSVAALVMGIVGVPIAIFTALTYIVFISRSMMGMMPGVMY